MFWPTLALEMPLAGPSTVTHMGSPGTFSGLISEQESSKEGEIHEAGPSGSVVLQSALALGPVKDVSGNVDRPIADMVNQLFTHSLQDSVV